MAQDAIALLDADHQRVEALFKDYQSARDATQKRDIAQLICLELTVHTQIEEEIFYPAVRKATGENEMVQEAEQEHQEAKQLIQKIQSSQDQEALVKELQKAVMHHVEEEREQMFKEAQSAGNLDLKQLARQLEHRKNELVNQHQEA